MVCTLTALRDRSDRYSITSRPEARAMAQSENISEH
jgi:hypothetical protein